MEIVIKVPDYFYERVNKDGCMSYTDAEVVVDAFYRGVVLTKGHGDLVDRSKICKAIPAEEDNCTGMGMTLEEMEAYNDGIDDMYRLVQGALTIIEADKEATDGSSD